MELNLNITLNGTFTELTVPVEENMLIIDLIFSIEMLMKTLTEDITTFDIYDINFQRIALIDENEVYISEEYKEKREVFDLDSLNIEVIGLGKTPVRKVLQEERDLLVALENYKQ